jgi:hypothetical protein
MKEIVTYLSQFYASTARSFTDKMKKQVSALKNLPYIGQAYEDDPISGGWLSTTICFFMPWMRNSSWWSSIASSTQSET